MPCDVNILWIYFCWLKCHVAAHSWKNSLNYLNIQKGVFRYVKLTNQLSSKTVIQKVRNIDEEGGLSTAPNTARTIWYISGEGGFGRGCTYSNRASSQLAPSNSQDNLNTQRTVLTNNIVLVASVVNGAWRQQPQQNLFNSVFMAFMSACVIEFTNID